jgi:hypothetical protein
VNTFNGVDISPGADPIRNVIHQRADNAGGERRPQQGEHHPSVGAKQKIELVMVIGVPSHGIPACSGARLQSSLWANQPSGRNNASSRFLLPN